MHRAFRRAWIPSTEAAKTIAKRVAAITGGKFQIRVFGAGEIVPAFGTVDAVQQGTVECTHTASYYFVGKNKTFAFDTTLPFGMNQRQQNAWIYYGGGLELVRAFFRDFNIISFPAGNTGCQMGGWFRKEVRTVKDLKGVKMRIAGLGGEAMARLGAVPQQIAGGDIYPALERGTIDAAEWVGPYDDEKLGFYKIAPHYYYPGWWEADSMYSLFVNIKEWEKLPKEYQAAVEAACYEANIDMMAKYDFQNPQALQRLVKNGVVRNVRGRGGKESFVEKDLRTVEEVPRGRIPLAPCCRAESDDLPAHQSDQSGGEEVIDWGLQKSPAAAGLFQRVCGKSGYFIFADSTSFRSRSWRRPCRRRALTRLQARSRVLRERPACRADGVSRQRRCR